MKEASQEKVFGLLLHGAGGMYASSGLVFVQAGEKCHG